MILPMTFKKFQGTISLAGNKNDEAKINNEAKKGGGKKGNKKTRMAMATWSTIMANLTNLK
jgi:hypothetical protein